jgi:hypothetical protein
MPDMSDLLEQWAKAELKVETISDGDVMDDLVKRQDQTSTTADPANQAPTAPLSKSTETTSSDAGSTTTTVEASPTSPPNDSSSSGSSNSVSVGALAGAAVGCLIAGLLIGFLVAFLLGKRRRKTAADPRPGAAAYPSELTMLAPKTADASIEDSNLDLAQFLLDGEADGDIAAELHSLGDLIYQHVGDHYHLQPVQVDKYILAQRLANLGLSSSSGLAPEAVAALCINPQTRLPALRHVVSQVLLQSIDPNQPAPLSLLPAPVAAFMQTMPAAGSKAQKSPAYTAALSRWRKLSAWLLHPNPMERTHLPVAHDMASQQAAALSVAVAACLQVFVSQGDEAAATEHLQLVAMECAEFGYVLFSHPADWSPIYTAGGGQDIVVCPGLGKVGSRGAQQRVVDPVLAQL